MQTAQKRFGRKARRGKTPGQQEAMLRAAKDGLSAEVRRAEEKRLRRQKNRLYGYPVAEVNGVAGRKGGMACSHSWADANWHNGTPYPPGGDTTGMICCPSCGAYMPPQNIGSSGHCDDCRLAAMSFEEVSRIPSSPGTVNLAMLKATRKQNKTRQ